MLNRSKFEDYEIEPYRKQIQHYRSLKNTMQFGGLVLLGIFNVCQYKMWFKLTANPAITYCKLAFIFFMPGFVFGKKIDRKNYEFYKNYQLKIQNILTLEEKKSMKLSELIGQYE